MKASCFVSIKNPRGIEVRDIDRLVVAASGFDSDVHFDVCQSSACAKSLFALITLDWRQGSVVGIHADGEDATAAIKTLANLIDSI